MIEKLVFFLSYVGQLIQKINIFFKYITFYYIFNYMFIYVSVKASK